MKESVAREPMISEVKSVRSTSDTYKCPESEFVVCGINSVRSIGPPFQVEEPLILTLTPCVSLEARVMSDTHGHHKKV